MNPSEAEGGDDAYCTHTQQTTILPVDPTKIGRLIFRDSPDFLLDEWDVEWDEDSQDVSYMRLAAHQLRTSDIPVAFPTETVYGLGADATRSTAVRGIFKAKQRPSDNPLIVHISSLRQLRSLLQPSTYGMNRSNTRIAQNGDLNGETGDPIPSIYKPLIWKFWPGPLTIILPNPENSALAPEVTAGLDTFGARMPRSLLALLLIKMSGIPIAAPSANASTKPSPTAAEHVKDDLDGRIATIIDGGPSEIGVESTVVDGLSYPPAILRPGGVSIEQLRECPGWENVIIGYKDASEKGGKPRAPGMKYRHYAPRATVILYEAGMNPSHEEILSRIGGAKSVGIIRTRNWPMACGFKHRESSILLDSPGTNSQNSVIPFSMINGSSSTNSEKNKPGISQLMHSVSLHCIPTAHHLTLDLGQSPYLGIWEIFLGHRTEDIGRGLFSALRELDKKLVDVILVEGIDDVEGDVAAAVMNRLRKAAEVKIKAG